MVPHLPPVRLVRNLTIFLPTEQLLRALSADSSGFSGARFVVEAFVMPLYVPSDHIYYTFGGRLGALSGNQERWWTISDDSESEVMKEVLNLTRKEGLPFLNRINDPRDLAEHIHRDVDPDNRRTDPHLAESEAYSWILAGEPHRALAAFDRLARIASDHKDPSLWVQDVARRGEAVRKLLEVEPSEAVKQLAIWRAYTLAALKLDA